MQEAYRGERCERADHGRENDQAQVMFERDTIQNSQHTASMQFKAAQTGLGDDANNS